MPNPFDQFEDPSAGGTALADPDPTAPANPFDQFDGYPASNAFTLLGSTLVKPVSLPSSARFDSSKIKLGPTEQSIATTGYSDPSQEPESSWLLRQPDDPGQIQPMSAWDRLTFKASNLADSIFPGMAEKASPSPAAVIGGASMVAPFGLPGRLGKLVMAYFAGSTALEQPQIISNIQQELKRGDYTAAQRETVGDILNLGVLGAGAYAAHEGGFQEQPEPPTSPNAPTAEAAAAPPPTVAPSPKAPANPVDPSATQPVPPETATSPTAPLGPGDLLNGGQPMPAAPEAAAPPPKIAANPFDQFDTQPVPQEKASPPNPTAAATTDNPVDPGQTPVADSSVSVPQVQAAGIPPELPDVTRTISTPDNMPPGTLDVASELPPTIAERAAAAPDQPVTMSDLAALSAELKTALAKNQITPSEPTPVEQPTEAAPSAPDAGTTVPPAPVISDIADANTEAGAPVTRAGQTGDGSRTSPDLGNKILSSLDSLKFDFERGARLGTFGLAPHVWNTLIDGVRLSVKGGMGLRDAIDRAVSNLKARGLADGFDEIPARVVMASEHLNPVILPADDSWLKGNIVNNARAREIGRTLQGTTVRNNNTGWNIKINRVGIEHTLWDARAYEHFQSVGALPELLKDAVLVNTAADTAGRPHIKAYHTLAGKLRIGDREFAVKMTVREMQDGTKFYDHELLQSERPADKSAGPGASGSVPAPSPDYSAHPLKSGDSTNHEQLTAPGRAVKAGQTASFGHLDHITPSEPTPVKPPTEAAPSAPDAGTTVPPTPVDADPTSTPQTDSYSPDHRFNLGNEGVLDHGTTQAAVDAYHAGQKNAPEVEIVHRPDWTHNGYGIRGTVQDGKIILNRAFGGDAETVTKVLREEHNHLLLSSDDGRRAIRAAAHARLGEASMSRLAQLYPRQAGEAVADYRDRLVDEYIAKAASERQPAWRSVIERVKTWLASKGLARLSDDETARAIIRALKGNKSGNAVSAAQRFSAEPEPTDAGRKSTDNVLQSRFSINRKPKFYHEKYFNEVDHEVTAETPVSQPATTLIGARDAIGALIKDPHAVFSSLGFRVNMHSPDYVAQNQAGVSSPLDGRIIHALTGTGRKIIDLGKVLTAPLIRETLAHADFATQGKVGAASTDGRFFLKLYNLNGKPVWHVIETDLRGDFITQYSGMNHRVLNSRILQVGRRI